MNEWARAVAAIGVAAVICFSMRSCHQEEMTTERSYIAAGYQKNKWGVWQKGDK